MVTILLLLVWLQPQASDSMAEKLVRVLERKQTDIVLKSGLTKGFGVYVRSGHIYSIGYDAEDGDVTLMTRNEYGYPGDIIHYAITLQQNFRLLRIYQQLLAKERAKKEKQKRALAQELDRLL